jgi:hypothetical protein
MKNAPGAAACYCVVDLLDGAVRYAGSREWAAACALVPGTCYGKGETEFGAEMRALLLRDWFLQRLEGVLPDEDHEAREGVF